ncbi:MAG: glycosyltransferase family 4 protein [Arthrospira sp. SH-MAG29]|nr:glycosyltransferase family 4 protein [Arthrospira sp. SH-MAG29]MBS0015712.1 glycosyltransferase family 4 protein [Arthrospira sp. SH-MAG29]
MNNQSLRISILVWNLSTNDGVIRATLLGNALKQLGYPVKILGFTFGEGLYKAIPSDWEVISVPGETYPQFFQSMRMLLAQIDGDLIYAVKPQPASFGVSLIYKFLKKKPIILDIDDWEMSWHSGQKEWRYRPSLKQLARDIFKKQGALRYPNHPLYLTWMEKLISRADAITVHTRFLQSRFGGIMVPNGKDTTLFDPGRYEPHQSRVNYGLEGYRILMFPGAPRPYKGVEDVLMALDLIDQSDLKLVIVGGSPYDNYDDILMEKWGRWIIKLPNFPAEKMPEIVAAAHVIVVPQRDHPATRAQFPLKLTDGMAMAKPVLASRVGDIPEILGDTGYLVEPNSPEQIADTLKLIFEDLDVANHRGLQARQRCVELYSIEAMANVLSNVMDQVM